MRYEFTTRNVWRDPRSAFERKWGVSGYTTPIQDDTIKVVVESEPFADEDAVITALGHEVGHSTQVADGAKKPSQMTHDERFECEVNAWVREFEVGSMTYLNATLMLDALNTYRRSYKIDDVVWQGARVKVEPLCETKVIREYIPLEPDPNDEGMPCAGVGGYAGEGDGGESEADEGEGDEGEGDEGEGDGGEGEPTTNGKGDPAKNVLARDEWLHSQEGIDFTRAAGPATFVEHMKNMGWTMNNLPAVTKATAGWIG